MSRRVSRALSVSVRSSFITELHLTYFSFCSVCTYDGSTTAKFCVYGSVSHWVYCLQGRAIGLNLKQEAWCIDFNVDDNLVFLTFPFFFGVSSAIGDLIILIPSLCIIALLYSPSFTIPPQTFLSACFQAASPMLSSLLCFGLVIELEVNLKYYCRKSCTTELVLKFPRNRGGQSVECFSTTGRCIGSIWMGVYMNRFS